MMRLSTAEQRPVNVLFEYFERAIEELGLRGWVGLLRPGKEDYFQKKVSGRVYLELASSAWKHKREAILLEPQKHLRWEPWEGQEEEILSHYRFQSAVMATLMRDGKELKTLAAQLVVEPMNRKLEVSHFLGNLTDGKVGLVYAELPTRGQILQWVHEIGQVQLTDRIPEIARFKYQ